MKKAIIMFLFATLILGSCNNTNNNQPKDNPSQNANNSENVVDNKENKDAIEFDADVWKSKDYVARYNMIESLFKQNNYFDFRYTLQDLTNLLGEPDKIDEIVLETYPTQFGGYQYYYWVNSLKYSGRREWILFSITPQEKVGGYTIDAYGYNDDFGDEESIYLSDGYGYEDFTAIKQYNVVLNNYSGRECLVYINDNRYKDLDLLSFIPGTKVKIAVANEDSDNTVFVVDDKVVKATTAMDANLMTKDGICIHITYYVYEFEMNENNISIEIYTESTLPDQYKE